jgi:hypothetical protein
VTIRARLEQSAMSESRLDTLRRYHADGTLNRSEVDELWAEIDRLTHHERLIDAASQRGITDCSTPLFVRVRNIVEQLEKVEAELARLTPPATE